MQTGDGGLVALFNADYYITNGLYAESHLETRTWRPSVGWSVSVEVQFDQAIVGAIEVERDPESGEILALVNTDTGNGANVQTRFMRWISNGWGDPSLIATGGVHFIEVGDPFATSRARPRSAIFAVPSPNRRTFPGLTSRWTKLSL